MKVEIRQVGKWRYDNSSEVANCFRGERNQGSMNNYNLLKTGKALN